MSLLDDQLKARLPPLYSQDVEPDPMVYAKFILAAANWTWYVMEGEVRGDDFLFFGFVVGFESEFGYFMLSELESVCDSFGPLTKRDLTFTEGRLTEVVPAPD